MKTIQLEQPRPTGANTSRIDMPSSIGRGGIDILAFSSGLNLWTGDWQFEKPVILNNVFEEQSVGFSFCLDGRFEFQASCLDRPFTAFAGECGFFSFLEKTEAIEKNDDRKMLRVSLTMKGEHLARLAEGDEDRFYPVLKSLDLKSGHRIGDNTTPVMKAVLYQILHCPYQGRTRQIFLEGKAMELLAHKLNQLDPTTGSSEPSIRGSDVERIQLAAHLLVNDLGNPPDIMTLARQTGLNRNKLHRCFRSVFGLSPFEYLRKQRLQKAMLLLQDGELNVTEAAAMVGYNNLSYFSKAFKSMFGIAPGELRNASPAKFQAHLNTHTI